MKDLMKAAQQVISGERISNLNESDKPSLIDVGPREGRDFLQVAADKFAELIKRDIPNYRSLDLEAVISEIMPQVLRGDFEAAKEQFGGFYDLLDELIPLVQDRLDLNESVRRSRNSRNLYEAPDISQYEIMHDPIVKPREAEDALYRFYKVMIDSRHAPDIKDESDAKRAAQGFEYVITTDIEGSGRVVDIYYNPNMSGKMEVYKAVRRVQTETSDVVVGNVAGQTSRRTASSMLNKMRFVGIIVDDKIYYSTHTNDRVEVRSGGETYFVDGGRVNPTYNTAAIIFTVNDGTIVPKQKRRRGNLNESTRRSKRSTYSINEASRYAQMSADDLMEMFDSIIAEGRSRVIEELAEEFAQVQNAPNDFEADQAEAEFMDQWEGTFKGALEDACNEAIDTFGTKLKRMSTDIYRSAPRYEG